MSRAPPAGTTYPSRQAQVSDIPVGGISGTIDFGTWTPPYAGDFQLNMRPLTPGIAGGAVNILHRRDIARSPTPQERREKLIDDYKARFANPYTAAERGYIDDVIVPHETRPKLIVALHTLQSKREAGPKRKHGNIPL